MCPKTLRLKYLEPGEKLSIFFLGPKMFILTGEQFCSQEKIDNFFTRLEIFQPEGFWAHVGEQAMGSWEMSPKEKLS